MRFYVLFIVVLLLGRNVFAQVDDNFKKDTALPYGSIFERVINCEVIFQLKDGRNASDSWFPIAGGKNGIDAFIPYRSAFSGPRAVKILKDLERSNKNGNYTTENLTLFLWEDGFLTSYYVCLWEGQLDLYRAIYEKPFENNSVKIAKYQALRSDIIWLCKNRYLLKLLEKDELTTEIYHFSPRELELLVRICPVSWMKKLHHYVRSENYGNFGYQGEQLKTLYGFLEYNPADAKKFPLLDEATVRKLANGLDGEIIYSRLFKDVGESCETLSKKLKTDLYITQRDMLLLDATINNKPKAGGHRNRMTQALKKRVVAKGEIEMLRLSIRQIERRKSAAGLAILAEYAQAKSFLDGKPEFQDLIMRQFVKREEVEVVWILAPLLKHKDPKLANRAKLIMQKHTSSDLGDDPEKWREWYREQNQ